MRHRQSQTLFLSELVDIRGCESPPYGELWNALHIAFVYDAIQRLPLLDEAYAAGLSGESQYVSSSGKENHSPKEPLPNPKKRRSEETHQDEEGDLLPPPKPKSADSGESNSTSPQAKRRRTLPDIGEVRPMIMSFRLGHNLAFLLDTSQDKNSTSLLRRHFGLLSIRNLRLHAAACPYSWYPTRA